MMEDTILVNYEPFIQESRIYIYKDGDKKLTNIYTAIEELANGLIGLAYGNEIYNIKVSGPFDVAGEIRRCIAANENNLYSQNKITVEGI